MYSFYLVCYLIIKLKIEFILLCKVFFTLAGLPLDIYIYIYIHEKRLRHIYVLNMFPLGEGNLWEGDPYFLSRYCLVQSTYAELQIRGVAFSSCGRGHEQCNYQGAQATHS